MVAAETDSPVIPWQDTYRPEDAPTPVAANATRHRDRDVTMPAPLDEVDADSQRNPPSVSSKDGRRKQRSSNRPKPINHSSRNRSSGSRLPEMEEQPQDGHSSLQTSQDGTVERECEIKEIHEQDEEPLLTEDAYSLLYTTKFGSKTSLWASFSIMIQGGMLLVTFLDLFDTSSEGNDTNGTSNRLEIPPGSTTEVMIAQFLGMLLTVMVMAVDGDLVIGITQLIKGYDPRIQERSENASWTKWLITGLLQSCFGVLLLVDSFILSMQSATVIDLSLNLTALHFIQEIDEMAFKLGAESGLLGEQVEADCEHVKNLKGYFTPAQKKHKLCRRRALIALMTIGLLVPYFILVYQQGNDRFMCKQIYIQFGDEYTPEMAHYSGNFRSQGGSFGQTIGGRNYYVDGTGRYQVAFCDAENFWSVSEQNKHNPCDFIFRSADTTSFDIIEVSAGDWFVKTELSGSVDVDWLKIVCSDCNEDTCPKERGQCSEEKDRCEAYSSGEYFGLNLQFQEECQWFALDQRTRDGLSAIPGTISFLDREYMTLDSPFPNGTSVSFYGFPIYVPYELVDIASPVNDANSHYEEQVDSFMVYTGRRWVLYAIPDENLARIVDINGYPSNWSRSEFILYFDDLNNETKFPTNIAALRQLTSDNINYFPIFFSSPVDYGEDEVGFDPSGVSWVHASLPYNTSKEALIPSRADVAYPVSARFLCTDCSKPIEEEDFIVWEGDDEFCLNGGICEGGYCVCQNFYSGFQCERVIDCVGAGSYCSGVGTCNQETRTCECEEGNYGSLCQLGAGAHVVSDPFLCNKCRLEGQGGCESPWSEACTCKDGWGGMYCNETLASNSSDTEETDSPTSNWDRADDASESSNFNSTSTAPPVTGAADSPSSASPEPSISSSTTSTNHHAGPTDSPSSIFPETVETPGEGPSTGISPPKEPKDIDKESLNGIHV